MKETSVIFYGAGDSAKFNYERFVDAGLIPDCFSDKDESKYHTQFDAMPYSDYSAYPTGGVSILPLVEAISRFPDYVIYPTQNPSVRPKIIEYLIENGVGRNRIRSFEEHGFEWRLGCNEMDSVVFFRPDRIMSCCKPTALITHFQGADITEAVKNYESSLKKISDDLLKGRQTTCDGCSDLKFGYFQSNPSFKTATVGGVYSHTKCNCKCIYCNYFDQNEDFSVSALEIMRQIPIVYPGIKKIQFVFGEPTIDPDFTEIIHICEQNNLSVLVFTSGIAFSEELAEMMKKGRGCINVSLDSGTPETYAKVKNVDCFDKVVGNLYKYAETDGEVELKYILLENINDNEDEFAAFLDIAMRIKPKVLLSIDSAYYRAPLQKAKEVDALTNQANISDNLNRLSKQHLDLIKHMISECSQKNLVVELTSFTFHPSDFAELEACRKNIYK